MEVTVDRAEMIKNIERELTEYKSEFQNTIKIYKKKLKEYSSYVDKQVTEGTEDTIRSPPYPPSSKIDDFEESIEMLQAHVDNTIQMEDHEFKNLKNGIKELMAGHRVATASLNAISYG